MFCWLKNLEFTAIFIQYMKKYCSILLWPPWFLIFFFIIGFVSLMMMCISDVFFESVLSFTDFLDSTNACLSLNPGCCKQVFLPKTFYIKKFPLSSISKDMDVKPFDTVAQVPNAHFIAISFLPLLHNLNNLY